MKDGVTCSVQQPAVRFSFATIPHAWPASSAVLADPAHSRRCSFASPPPHWPPWSPCSAGTPPLPLAASRPPRNTSPLSRCRPAAGPPAISSRLAHLAARPAAPRQRSGPACSWSLPVRLACCRPVLFLPAPARGAWPVARGAFPRHTASLRPTINSAPPVPPKWRDPQNRQTRCVSPNLFSRLTSGDNVAAAKAGLGLDQRLAYFWSGSDVLAKYARIGYPQVHARLRGRVSPSW